MGHTSVPLVKMVKLGRVSYSRALRMQAFLQQRHLKSAENCDHTLLVLEHDPVYTFGLREKITEEQMVKLTEGGAQVIKSDRGGLTTFHGPGQLVAYPIVNLKLFRNMPLRGFVNALELTAIHTCRMFGVLAVNGAESAAHTGAWVNNEKVCAIGVHCKRYITTHGLALNCNTNLEWFQRIVPCGIQDRGVTSLSAALDRNVSVDKVLDQFTASFEAIFSCRTVEQDVNEAFSGLPNDAS